ncbi:hypothetical protein [Geosporobacter ferrireducens]|uniref:Uncharacterized protein n=1 Tax=Geosporobacter ferrireducens TaxID=1424294 RepID=A0A1D8GIQ7_9FIRM|nr:hypothetical protein [Geosporobacter ferrireducens]AOT70787.1 hypothetical protein Gferi_15115 [Geosporobacter ferrireducens]MTI57278.1 hypothetical protein [Geosporobacter ferrireducens]
MFARNVYRRTIYKLVHSSKKGVTYSEKALMMFGYDREEKVRFEYTKDRVHPEDNDCIICRNDEKTVKIYI